MNWLNNLTSQQVIGTVVAIASGGFGGFKLIQRLSLGGHVRRIMGIEPSAEELRLAMDNMNQIVMSQGQSIDWLTNQLTTYRQELDEAHEKLKEMEVMHIENTALRIRVSELEGQVKALEEEIARRKKFTRKDSTN